ncbi:MAG: hypothetical protein JXQ73_17510 [Phycisphaerae bacterium]|nr:hypothetical protein [Phycisphaerae bacterium]
MLLEVLISVAIMVLAIATIGSQVNQALKTADYTDKLNRGLMLAEWALAEMDLSMDSEERIIDLQGEEGEGTFGERFPGYGWRIKREPTDTENFDLITLDILTGDPESESVGDWKVLHSVYALRPIVAEVDPADFGMPSEEEIGLLAAASATGADGQATDASELPAGFDELLAALPAPLQEIFQRFLGGEAVPLDEVRAAFGELTTEDMLSLVTAPGLLGLLSGGVGGLSGGAAGGATGDAAGGLDQALQGGGNTNAIQQMLQGGAGGASLQKQLQNLMPGR